jgi:hypothetical protein
MELTTVKQTLRAIISRPMPAPSPPCYGTRVLVGVRVGRTVEGVGARDGVSEGSRVGALEGRAVGRLEGVCDGARVGPVGERLGPGVGLREGADVGVLEGSLVGRG